VLIGAALLLPRLEAQNATQTIGSFLLKNCQTCHNSVGVVGGVDADALAANPDFAGNREIWTNIGNAIRNGQMPPVGAPKPAPADVTAVVAALDRTLASLPQERAAAKPQAPAGPPTKDWTTYHYDSARTGWARGETTLTKANVSQLGLLWRLQLDAKPNTVNLYSTTTEPLVMNAVPMPGGPKRVLYIASLDNDVYAIDADKGTVIWKRSFPYNAPPPNPPSGNCPNNLNATPVIDKESGIMYVLANDGKLRGLSIIDGEDKYPATAMVPHYTRNFSLNYVDGWVYAGTTRGCGNAPASVVALNVKDPERQPRTFFTSQGKFSGPWGRAGIVATPYGVVTQTADGTYDPLGGRWGETVIAFSRELFMVDTFTPKNYQYLNDKDLDLGSSSPVVFDYGGKTLIASTAKEGLIYLMDAHALGGADHRTPLYTSPRWSNDAVLLGLNGMWSVMTTYVDSRNRRWLLAPYMGPAAKDTIGQFKKQHGEIVNGALFAFTIEGSADKPVVVPQWVSGDLDVPGVSLATGGLVFVTANGERGGAAMRPARGAAGRGAAAAPAAPGVEGPGRGGAAANGPGRGGAAAGGGGRGNAAGGGGGRGGRGFDPNLPGYETDTAFQTSQTRPPDQGGQQGGTRYNGGRETTHTVLYALDPETGDELYSSGGLIDSWNHYGDLTLSDGRLYVGSYDARVYAFGLGGKKQ
jgi:outer membrane protein assembly factor BamB